MNRFRTVPESYPVNTVPTETGNSDLEVTAKAATWLWHKFDHDPDAIRSRFFHQRLIRFRGSRLRGWWLFLL